MFVHSQSSENVEEQETTYRRFLEKQFVAVLKTLKLVYSHGWWKAMHNTAEAPRKPLPSHNGTSTQTLGRRKEWQPSFFSY
jgi:hypothetical protein